MSEVLLILSGGMDSATLLYHLLDQGESVTALSFDYGQRHGKELACAAALADKTLIRHRVVDLSALKPFLSGSSQTDDAVAVPEGHYAAENMKLTVVPNRNMIMLAVAAAAAISEHIPHLAYGAHAGDHAIYPDCRPEFVDIMGRAFALCDWNPVQLLAPFLNQTKGQILTRGLALKVPYELTWTCYKGGDVACGKCGSCQERLEAFAQNNATDPVKYVSAE